MPRVSGVAKRVIEDPTAVLTGEIFNKVMTDAAEHFKESLPNDNAPQRMHSFREDFKELLKRADIDRLIVLIDDLDRCLPTTAIATLEAIRLPVIAKSISSPLSPFTFMALVNFFVGIISLFLAMISEKPLSIDISSQTLKAILFFSAVNAIAFWAFLFASSRMPIAQYQLFIILTPIVGGSLAWFFLGEPINPKYLVSFVIVATGLLIAIRA